MVVELRVEGLLDGLAAGVVGGGRRKPATSEASRMKIDRNELELSGGGSRVDM